MSHVSLGLWTFDESSSRVIRPSVSLGLLAFEKSCHIRMRQILRITNFDTSECNATNSYVMTNATNSSNATHSSNHELYECDKFFESRTLIHRNASCRTKIGHVATHKSRGSPQTQGGKDP